MSPLGAHTARSAAASCVLAAAHGRDRARNNSVRKVCEARKRQRLAAARRASFGRSARWTRVSTDCSALWRDQRRGQHEGRQGLGKTTSYTVKAAECWITSRFTAEPITDTRPRA
eukprot:Amastigsp_a179400_21.p3 type:complete len:115 gc:universal Amastigsp_a179400_21:243-587(+)